MNKELDNANGETPRPETPGAKLPYTKPTLRFEGVFETMALACGKINSTQGQCHASPRNS